jgi:hypothetical protein
MILLAFDFQRVTHLAPYEHNGNLTVCLIHVVEHAKITEPQFVSSQWIWSKLLDGSGEPSWLINQPCRNPIVDNPLFSRRHFRKLGLGLEGDYNAMGHLEVEVNMSQRPPFRRSGVRPPFLNHLSLDADPLKSETDS